MRGKRVLVPAGRGPGGDESPEDGALRELKEECGVEGRVVRQTSQLFFGPQDEHQTFLVDIGDQEPTVGSDPEVAQGQEILIDVGWLALPELSEKDRVFLWGAGLLGVEGFYAEVAGWADETSYPRSERRPGA